MHCEVSVYACDSMACLQKLLWAQACSRPGTVGSEHTSPIQAGGQEGRGLGRQRSIGESLQGLRGTFIGRGHTAADKFDDQRLVLVSNQAYPALGARSSAKGARLRTAGRAEARASSTSEVLPVAEVKAWRLCRGAWLEGKAQVVLAHPNPWGRGELCWEERPGHLSTHSWGAHGMLLLTQGPLALCAAPANGGGPLAL